MGQVEVWAMIAQTALTYIFVSVATSNSQKQTVLDNKQDLRTTKEDLLAELKNSRESLLHELELASKSQIDIITSHIEAIEKGKGNGQN